MYNPKDYKGASYINDEGKLVQYDKTVVDTMVNNTSSIKKLTAEIEKVEERTHKLRSEYIRREHDLKTKNLTQEQKDALQADIERLKAKYAIEKAQEDDLKRTRDVEAKSRAEQYKGLAAAGEDYRYKKASFVDKLLIDERRIANLKQQAEELAHNKEKEEAYKETLKTIEEIEKKAEARKKAFELYQTKSLMGRLELQNKRLKEDIQQRKEQAQQDYINARETGDYEGAKKASKEEFQAGLAENFANVGEKITKGLEELGDKFDQYIDDAMQIATDYKSFMDARLQGSNKNFNDINKTLRQRLTASPFVKTTEVLKSIKELADAGIVYNLELRGFLSSVSDQIAATFEANNATLLRLIRLQQADSTAARMGIEAALIKSFNSTFADSSYLNDVYDTVSSAILEANSQLDRDRSAEFEYAVQKWLGSLYSVGLSQAAVTTIAGGINALATGDVETLSGNSQLTTLFAMAASRAGLPYGQLLIGGLRAEETNELLKAMVEYLQEISDTNNQVVKAAYGNVLNLSLSDFAALRNLTAGDISNIYSSSMSYSSAVGETQNQLTQLYQRQTVSQMINNLMANAQYSLGSIIADNPMLYIIYKSADLLESMTGGIHLPNIGVLGNFLDLTAFTIEGIIKGSVMGIGAIGTLIDAIQSLGSGMGMSLSSWGGSDITPRGSGFGGGITGFSSGVSQSAIIASGSSEDIYKSSVAGAAEEAETVGEITSANTKDVYTVDDLYKTMLLQEHNYEPINVKLSGDSGNLKVDLAAISTDKLLEILRTVLMTYGIAGLLGYGLEGKDVISPSQVAARDWKNKNPRLQPGDMSDWVQEESLQENATLQQALNEIVFGKVNVNIASSDISENNQIKDLYTYDFTAGNGM